MNILEKYNSAKLGAYLKELRLKRGYSLRHLAYKTGLSYSFISKLERGERDIPKLQTMESLSNGLDVSLKSILEHANITWYPIQKSYSHKKTSNNITLLNDDNTIKIPLIGNIKCDDQILAQQNIEEYIPAIKDSLPSGVNFALRFYGDSMAPKINNDSIVIVHQQSEVEDGSIAGILIDGDATLRKVQHIDNKILLLPINNHYKPIMFYENNNNKILGKAVKVIMDL